MADPRPKKRIAVDIRELDIPDAAALLGERSTNTTCLI